MNHDGMAEPQYDAIVIGAGICGIYQAYRLQALGMRFIVLERAEDVGGTWFWNRYPGCRFDSESETYGYSFSPELLSEWDWTEKFAPREETERYLRHVVDRFDLRRHMRFGQQVTAARWCEEDLSWTVETANGEHFTTRFLLTAIGLLSTPTLPRYRGVERFLGQSFHTYHHPRDGVDYRNKRVAVIGTGSTGVQVIGAIADRVGSLTVFQRRPNWCAPLRNAPITPEQMAQIKARYDEIFAQCRSTPGGFIHGPDVRKVSEVPADERERLWEKLYAGSGFGIWLANFRDILTDTAANEEFTRFVADRIRERVKDPAVAAKLIPTDHGFGTRRPPMETNYYEAYNRDNVRLVDISETPIEEITPSGLRTTAESFEFDIIVYATGFDAITGAYEKIDFVGTDGQTLRHKWREGPVSSFGMAIAGFPNLMTVAGPLSASVVTNFPRGIEEAVNWTSDFLAFIREKGVKRFEASHQAEADWDAHVQHMAGKVLFSQQKSWFTGYNTNIDRHYKPKAIVYAGGALRFRSFLQDQVDQDYPAFILGQCETTSARVA